MYKNKKRASATRYRSQLTKKRSELDKVEEQLLDENLTEDEVVELEDKLEVIKDEIELLEDVILDVDELISENEALTEADAEAVVEAVAEDVSAIVDEDSENRAEMGDDVDAEVPESEMKDDAEDVYEAMEESRSKKVKNSMALKRTKQRNGSLDAQRRAFMDIVQGNIGSLESYKRNYSAKEEQNKLNRAYGTRAAGSMNTTNNAVLIPQTILDLVFTGIHEYGNILDRLNLKDYQGKAIVPVSDFAQIKAVIRAEGEASVSTQVVTDELIFGFFALEAMIEQTDIANTVGLANFETQFADMVLAAVISEMENIILNGTGVSQPLGILNTDGIKEYDAELSYTGIMTSILPKIKTGYKNGFFIGTTAAFYNLKGLVDANGQPIAGVTQGSDNDFINRFYSRDFVVADHVGLEDDKLVYIVGDKVVVNNNLRPTVETWYEQRENKHPTRVKTYFDSKLVDPDAAIVYTLIPKP